MPTKADSSTSSVQALAAASRKRLAEAQSTLDLRQRTKEQAEQDKTDLLARAATDDAVTPEELVTLDAAIVLADQRLSGSKAAVLKAERELVNDETDLAEALVPIVTTLLPGVTVTVTTQAPKEPSSDLLAAFIVQPKPCAQNYYKGSISGEAQILYYRTPLHMPLSANALKEAAHDMRVYGEFHPVGADVTSGAPQVIRADIRHATVPVPVLSTSSEGEDSSWHFFRQAIAGEVRARSMRILPGDLARGGVPYRATGSALTDVVADDTDQTGKRTRRVRVTLGLDSTEGRTIDLAMLQGVGRRVFEALEGRPVEGLGRVTATEVTEVGRGPVNHAHHYMVRGELTLVCQVYKP